MCQHQLLGWLLSYVKGQNEKVLDGVIGEGLPEEGTVKQNVWETPQRPQRAFSFPKQHHRP